ncbi:MAG: nuclear transport factor 2 family protein [Actinomycetota bacterium]|nr:nuclear transport factor 2 family protein [Actinomycetota bacterium]
MSKQVADKFVEALWRLEEDRDVEELVEIHTEDCTTGNVAVRQTFNGHDGLREFWTNYRNTFDDMKSEFHNVFADGDGHAALEWTTEGSANGNTVSYQGVSILEIEDGKVKRFMAYFDPRSLTEQVVS